MFWPTNIKKPPTSSGQALLIVVLSMAVVLTVALSVISFSITDVSNGTRQEESARAFSAAEAGVEKALVALQNIGSTQVGDANYSVSVSSVSPAASGYTYPTNLATNDVANFWLSGHDANGNLSCSSPATCAKGQLLDVCWGEDKTPDNINETPAIEVSVFYLTSPGNNSSAQVARIAIDPNGGRIGTNKFVDTDLSCTMGTTKYAFKKTIDLKNDLGLPPASYNASGGLVFAQVRMLYNTTKKHPVAMAIGGDVLPIQGYKITSTGTSGDSARKIEVYKLYPSFPTVFSTSLFAQGGISQ
jgi:hypothetical protein